MRLLSLMLAVLLLLIQYPLWLGKGGLLRVWEMERQIDVQRASNARLQARNAALDAEVRDLKQGLEAVEERARNELGMIRRDEVFFQVPETAPPAQPGK
jgi:cell division protein FtsB